MTPEFNSPQQYESMEEVNLIGSTGVLQQELQSTASPLDRIVSFLRRIPALDLFVACGLTLLISSAVSLEPEYHDGAIFSYVGEMWTRGAVPYLQVFDNKPPGIFLLTALAAGTGHTLWSLAVMNFVFVMAAILAIRKTLQIAGAPRQTVFFGTVATALMVNLQFYGAGNMPEDYMLAPMAASMCAFVYGLRSGSLRAVFLAGIFSGLACMFKPFALSVFMAQVVFVVLTQAPQWRTMFRSVLANTAGAAAAWIPAFIYFALHGALRQMLDGSFFYNVHYGAASQPKPLALITSLATTLLPLSTMLGCVLIGLVTVRRNASPVPGVRGALWNLTLLWFGFALILVLMAGRGYRHYFMSLIPSLSVAAALVFWSIEEHKLKRSMRLAFAALMLFPILMAQVPGLIGIAHDYQAALSHQHQIVPVEVAATELQRVAPPSSTVFVWGFEPYILSATHLRSAFRFPTSHYVYDSPRSYDEIGREVLHGMRTAPPDYVVLTPWDFSMSWPHSSDPVQDQFMATIRHSYTKLWEKDAFALYRHN